MVFTLVSYVGVAIMKTKKKREIVATSFSFYRVELRVMLFLIILDWDFLKLLNISFIFILQQLFLPLRNTAESSHSAMAV